MSTEFSGDTQKPWKASNATEVILEYIYKQMTIVAGAAPLPPGALATEAKQDALIVEIMKMIDFEISCVIDTVTGVVYLMNIEKNETTGAITVTYLDAQGNTVVPPVPGNLVVCDASASMALLLAELVTLNAGGQLLTEATFVAEDFATQATLAIQAADIALIEGYLDSSVRTPTYSIDVTVGVGSVAAGARSVSIKNNGAVPVTVTGALLPVGESIGFDAGGQGDTLGAIAYNIPATGSLQILKVV